MKRIALPDASGPSWIFCILALAGLTYALSLNYHYFGRFNDDARHFLAAQSLLQGRYVNLAHPQDPPLLNQLPGYPLLLVPAAAARSPRLAQWMSVGFILGSLLLLLRLLGKTTAGRAAVALTALHPLSVIESGSVMTEAPYLFFTAWTLVYFVRLLDQPKKLRVATVAGLAALCAWCGWIHPQGAALFLAVSLLLLENRSSRRWGWMFIGAGGLFLAIPYLGNLWISGSPATYFGELPAADRGLLRQASAMAAIVWANLRRYPSLLGNEGMLSWTDPLYGAGSVLAKGVGLGLLIAMAMGLQNAMKAGNLGRAIGAYVICYVGLHLFWVNQFFRYVFPMLPFLYWLLFSSPLFSARPRWAAGLCAALAALFVALDTAIAVNSRIPRQGENVPPLKTIAWIRANVPEDAVLASGFDETLHYYTGRKYVQPISLSDPDDWFHRLVAEHVRYFVDYQGLEPMPSVPSRQRAIAQALRLAEDQLKMASRFSPLYQPADEPFAVHAVAQPEAFEKGYGLLQEAKDSIEQGRLQTAYQRLKQAEKMQAPLVRLPFYLGTTAMLLGKKQEARKYLLRALRQEPDFTPAQRNLALLNPGK